MSVQGGTWLEENRLRSGPLCFDHELHVLLPQAGLEGVVHRQWRDDCHQRVDQPASRQIAASTQDQGGAAADPDGGECWWRGRGLRGGLRLTLAAPLLPCSYQA